jgi:hypothetical protein
MRANPDQLGKNSIDDSSLLPISPSICGDKAAKCKTSGRKARPGHVKSFLHHQVAAVWSLPPWKVLHICISSKYVQRRYLKSRKSRALDFNCQKADKTDMLGYTGCDANIQGAKWYHFDANIFTSLKMILGLGPW